MMSIYIESEQRGKKLILFFFLFILFSFFGFRDNYYISDAVNYVIHTEKGFDSTNPSDYFYPIYWLLLQVIGSLADPESATFFLSLIVSACIVGSALELKANDRFVFLFLCVLSPAIFNTTQVALRNGVALGAIVLGLAYAQSWLIAISVLIHPGVLPVVLILFFLKNITSAKKAVVAAVVLGGGVVVLLPYVEALTVERGYTQEGRAADVVTYGVFFVLSLAYFFSLKKNVFRLFMPLMFALWVVTSISQEFGGRLFLQSLLISLFLFLKYSERGAFRNAFLLGFCVVSAYGAAIWHPIVEYHDGWIGYWTLMLR